MAFRSSRITALKGSTTSRVVAAVLLLTMVLAISGLPQPVRKQIKSGERFPCESCACGCSTAAYCWDQCCCHTDVQKLAWADKHGVQAPNFLVTRVALAKTKNASLVSKPSCCQKKVIASCCDKGSSSATCSDQHEATESTETQADDAPSIRFLSFRAYAKCQGMNWVWTLLNQSTVKVLDPCSEVDLDAPLIAWFQIKDDLLSSDSEAPDPPVPWFAV